MKTTFFSSIVCVLFILVSGCTEPKAETPNSTSSLDGSPAGSPDTAVQKPIADQSKDDASPQDKKALVTDNDKPAQLAANDSQDVADKQSDKQSPPTKSDDPKTDDSKKAANDGPGLAEIGSAKPDEGQPVPVDDGPPPTVLPKDLLGEGVRPLNKQGTVLIDVPRKKVFLKTHVTLRTGALEMLVCLKQTKEHESIVALDSEAFTIHTALVALGMKEGKAAYWKRPENEDDDPTFVPAVGQQIDIFVHWRDTKGKLHRERAQHWIRHTINRYYDEQFESLPADLKLIEDENLGWDELNKTLFRYGPMSDKQRDELLTRSKDKKYQATIKQFHKQSQPREMSANFLFVGSGFFVEEGKRQYLAEGGYVVCVANFNMAMIDISAESNSQGEALTYEGYTERIPPRKSEVLIELVPVLKPKANALKGDDPKAGS